METVKNFSVAMIDQKPDRFIIYRKGEPGISVDHVSYSTRREALDAIYFVVRDLNRNKPSAKD